MLRRMIDIKKIPLVVLVVLLTATMGTWHYMRTNVLEKGHDRFHAYAEECKNSFIDRMHDYRMVLRGSVGLFNASDDKVSRGSWRTYIQALDIEQNFPGTLGVGFSKRILPQEIASHVRQVRAEGFPGYSIHPAGERPEYTSIIYLEPFSGRNLQAFGYDMFSEPVRRAAMERARDEGISTLSGKVLLVQETDKDKQNGFLMYVPVYRRGMPHGNVEERRVALTGYVYSPFRVNDMMEGTLGEAVTKTDIVLYDGKEESAENLLYANSAGKTIAREQGNFRPVFTETSTFDLYGKTWTIRFRSLPSFEATIDTNKPLYVLLAGIVLTLLLFGTTFALALRYKALARIKEAEEALRESEERYRELFENAKDMIITYDLAGNFTSVNKAAEQTTGYTLDEFLKMNVSAVLAPEYVDVVRELMSREVAEREQGQLELVIVCKDGRRVPVEVSTRVIYKDGKPVGIQGIGHDITKRKLVEEGLRESEERLVEAQQVARLGYYGFDVATGAWTSSKILDEIFGIGDDYRRDFEGWTLLLHPEERQSMRDYLLNKVLAKKQPFNREYRIIRPSEQGVRWVHELGRVEYDSSGKPVKMIGTIMDITDRKRTEVEKDKLQAQLLQSQKMDAVGRLAGGVAHDFNNLLTVITGYSELLLQKIEKESPMHKEVEEIQRAGERAALLTRQLLTFSRKQVIEPKVLDLNLLMANLGKMLVRLIGENIHLEMVPCKDLERVKVDPGQFDQVLINLAVNARDAMPDGGTLLIETANVELDEEYCAQRDYEIHPGRFVILAVSDTGHGMTKEVTQQIYEPFFTMKAQGKGTGLGLSMVYGAVKQSGGSIEVYSEVGKGTTFKIYLPRVEEGAVKLVEDDRAAVLPTGTETLLVVEDEETVRKLGIRILGGLGYKVLQAGSGDEAISLAVEYKDRIDLLLTDVVMPGMNGAELARKLVLHRPKMKVLFTSGYTDDAITRHGVLDKGVSFIGKPYTPSALARKVREVLDGE